jgi:hypothetical protein
VLLSFERRLGNQAPRRKRGRSLYRGEKTGDFRAVVRPVAASCCQAANPCCYCARGRGGGTWMRGAGHHRRQPADRETRGPDDAGAGLRGRARERRATEFHTLVGNFIICAILGKKPAFGDAIKSEQVRMTAAIFYAKTKMGWKETVVNEQANKDDKPFLVDDARQRLIDEIDRIRARKEQKGE